MDITNVAVSSGLQRAQNRANVTLLLVDDDPIIRELFETILMLAGYTVITAADGLSAFEVASNDHFDMLVTDFQMPGLDGYTLATRLRQRRSSLPVLMVSGANSTDLPLEGLSHPNWNFLPKPVDRIRMLEIIDRECLGMARSNLVR